MKHTKHRYFFVKDKVDQGDIDIVHSQVPPPFPEDQIWANVLTEPKSGRLFLEDRSVLMNCPVNYVEMVNLTKQVMNISQRRLFSPKPGAPTSKFDEANFASPWECVGGTL